MLLGRFSSLKLKYHLNKNILSRVKNGVYTSTYQIYNINNYQQEMLPYYEIIDYVYNSLNNNKIKTYDNFYITQELYTNNKLNDINSFYDMRIKYKHPQSIYSVMYYYNINTSLIIRSNNFVHKPKENELLLINDIYNETFLKNGDFGILKFNFIK